MLLQNTVYNCKISCNTSWFKLWHDHSYVPLIIDKHTDGVNGSAWIMYHLQVKKLLTKLYLHLQNLFCAISKAPYNPPASG